MQLTSLIWLLPLPPLLAFAIIVLFTNRNKALSHSIALAGAGVSWLAAMWVFIQAVGKEGLAAEPFTSAIQWLPTGDTWLSIGVAIDPVGAVTVFFVAWTVLMIFIYSVGYHNYGQPKGDHDQPGLPPHGATVKSKKGHAHREMSVEPLYSRFFALISLFAAAMFLLVVSDNLLTLFVGWEVMGFCSYMLIGFWYGKVSARNAAVKAFLTTRIGDVFMLLGIVALYSATGTLNYRAALSDPAVIETLASTGSGVWGLSLAGLIGILIFIGVIGKSAQFPLHVWLPDAMEGPTPVSAMIHAATMVSAGVYLAIRIFPLVSAGWEPGHALTPAMMTLAFIGTFTALFASTIALAQNDIKRVLAYSTISQLGMMIAALGVGAYVAAVFHLVTHAFFKALLFLGSGSVIHGMEHGALHSGDHGDPQDMYNMGGLRKKMPLTFWTFLLGGLALSGFPLLTAGFWSKDEILAGAFGGGHLVIFISLSLTALLTAFYTARQITLTFLGEGRTPSAQHAHENRAVMTAPLVVLAVFAVGAGWVGIPAGFPLVGGLLPNWFGEFVGSMGAFEEHAAVNYTPQIVSVLVSLGGLTLGWLVYRNIKAGQVDPLKKALGPVHTLLKNKYYFDEFYAWAFIRPAVWLAEKVVYQFVDRRILDGFIEGIGKAALGLGRVVREGFDLPVVNGAGDGLSLGVRKGSEALRPVQSGRIQQYMLLTVAVVLIAALVFYLVLA